MVAAPRVAIAADVTARANYLVRAYADMVTDGARLIAVIERLRPFHPADRIAAWQAMAGAGAFVELAAALMQHHYDPRYDKHRARMAAGFTEIAVPRLNDLAGLADQVARAVLG